MQEIVVSQVGYDALCRAILRWKKVEAGEIWYDDGKCPLCETYRNCRGCPIAQLTGKVVCRGTPFMEFDLHIIKDARCRLARKLCPEGNRLAHNETLFLVDLLEVVKVRDEKKAPSAGAECIQNACGVELITKHEIPGEDIYCPICRPIRERSRLSLGQHKGSCTPVLAEDRDLTYDEALNECLNRWGWLGRPWVRVDRSIDGSCYWRVGWKSQNAMYGPNAVTVVGHGPTVRAALADADANRKKEKDARVAAINKELEAAEHRAYQRFDVAQDKARTEMTEYIAKAVEVRDRELKAVLDEYGRDSEDHTG